MVRNGPPHIGAKSQIKGKGCGHKRLSGRRLKGSWESRGGALFQTNHQYIYIKQHSHRTSIDSEADLVFDLLNETKYVFVSPEYSLIYIVS